MVRYRLGLANQVINKTGFSPIGSFMAGSLMATSSSVADALAHTPAGNRGKTTVSFVEWAAMAGSSPLDLNGGWEDQMTTRTIGLSLEIRIQSFTYRLDLAGDGEILTFSATFFGSFGNDILKTRRNSTYSASSAMKCQIRPVGESSVDANEPERQYPRLDANDIAPAKVVSSYYISATGRQALCSLGSSRRWRVMDKTPRGIWRPGGQLSDQNQLRGVSIRQLAVALQTFGLYRRHPGSIIFSATGAYPNKFSAFQHCYPFSHRLSEPQTMKPPTKQPLLVGTAP